MMSGLCYDAPVKEGPVTLQISAICKSGWVLASDRRELLYNHRSSTTKIFTDLENKMTYALVGETLVSKIVAQQLFKIGTSGAATNVLQMERQLESIANEGWQIAFDNSEAGNGKARRIRARFDGILS